MPPALMQVMITNLNVFRSAALQLGRRQCSLGEQTDISESTYIFGMGADARKTAKCRRGQGICHGFRSVFPRLLSPHPIGPGGTVVSLYLRFRVWCELKLHNPQHLGLARQVHRHPAGIYEIRRPSPHFGANDPIVL